MAETHNRMSLTAILFACLGSLVVFFIVVTGAAFLTFESFSGKKTDLPVPQGVYNASQYKPRAPLLNPSVNETLREARATEAERLKTYGWVDRAKGIIHIPIGRAIDQVLKEEDAR